MNDKVFERAVNARRDVTASYFGEFGFDAAKSEAMVESDMLLRRRLRPLMQAGVGGGRLFRLSDERATFQEQARALLNEGKVGAVDGTPALAKIDFMNTTQYAVAVGWLSSRTRADPEIIITETSSAYVDPDRIRKANDNDIAEICAQLDEARDSESWPTTFREYEERRVAIDLCRTSVVFIDGPIFTQNLITQELGRQLLDRLIGSDKTYIGVIKNLSNSWAMCRWCASTLETGEGYVLCTVGQSILERSTKAGHHEIVGWLGRTEEFVRVVYRPAEKAFAFECRKLDVGLACALLHLDASPTLQHELPLLIETIDSQLRAGFNCGMARNAVVNRIMVQRDGYRAAIDATDEREFR